jgi:hypothetical protein
LAFSVIFVAKTRFCCKMARNAPFSVPGIRFAVENQAKSLHGVVYLKVGYGSCLMWCLMLQFLRSKLACRRNCFGRLSSTSWMAATSTASK